ncbi:hypothetical protein A2115_02590 [Candidatus Woesebacteria bacterium GWA1_41_8]|uniref:Uncharacterized protein n=1 Tax=Candidatus Woesebacteria bacterium GWA1_41_8 TaxID=1802471 RepID=A0A1F7WIS7_9BACT|nr:MAG: hypothetical protein A2115_02590 [Candidatus Woesebacteria bacterium GWA1_41_8]
MADQERKTEQVQTSLEDLIDRGFSVARGLREEAETTRTRKVAGEESPSAEVYNHQKAFLLERAADLIQEELTFLEGRLLGIRHEH